MTLDEIAALSDEEAAAKVAELEATYRVALATPLMSDGNISPMQVGLMSDRQRKRWQDNAGVHITVRGWIRELKRPAADRQRDAQARAAAVALKADREDLDRAVRHIENGCAYGVGKRGKLTPTWQAHVARHQAEIRAVLERRPEMASDATARVLSPEGLAGLIAATLAERARRDAERAQRGGALA